MAPRLRGSSENHRALRAGRRVGPAPAGILRGAAVARARPARWPRACGDPPTGRGSRQQVTQLAPRLRGSSPAQHRGRVALRVGPAPAGILRGSARRRERRPRWPRACGDPPPSPVMGLGTGGLAPRLRGYSASEHWRLARAGVGPAPAGILRFVRRGPGRSGGWPRACGDPPVSPVRVTRATQLAPRLRGSSGAPGGRRPHRVVGPAPAGILLAGSPLGQGSWGWPRARGDPPWARSSAGNLCKSAPRAQGSSRSRPSSSVGSCVGPAGAGILRSPARPPRRSTCWPCGRGDLPHGQRSYWRTNRSTTRTRGSSDDQADDHVSYPVDPARAGILRLLQANWRAPGCPRAGGDLPTARGGARWLSLSAPRSWGSVAPPSGLRELRC
ncbi:hypothetical protein STTU_p0098 (plasmid) [Streptomyces sp. Tu6071]|nr:hypothetical protein STTU_p0098 [Streptomyces sp. Tu6071]